LDGNDTNVSRDGAVTKEERVTRRTVWIFHGDHGRYTSAVFETLGAGLEWAARHRATGILAEYAFGGAYDTAVDEGRFTPSKPHHGSPEHVAGFSPGLRHVHLTNGRQDPWPPRVGTGSVETALRLLASTSYR
jgi:hypothetical protein